MKELVHSCLLGELTRVLFCTNFFAAVRIPYTTTTMHLFDRCVLSSSLSPLLDGDLSLFQSQEHLMNTRSFTTSTNNSTLFIPVIWLARHLSKVTSTNPFRSSYLMPTLAGTTGHKGGFIASVSDTTFTSLLLLFYVSNKQSVSCSPSPLFHYHDASQWLGPPWATPDFTMNCIYASAGWLSRSCHTVVLTLIHVLFTLINPLSPTLDPSHIFSNCFEPCLMHTGPITSLLDI